MKHICLLLTVISVNFYVFSQSTTAFRVDYSVGLMNLPGNTIEGLTNNSYVFAGTNMTFIPLYGTVTQVDQTGNVVWSKRLSDNSIALQINDIKKDVASNAYYGCGGSESNDGVYYNLNANGNLNNSKKFGISEATGAFLQKIEKTSDGGYIAVGSVYNHKPGGGEIPFSTKTNTTTDGKTSTMSIGSPLIVKFDVNGNHVWHKVFRYYNQASKTPNSAIENTAVFRDVIETTDGFIAVGDYKVANAYSKYDDDGDDTTPTDALILKTDKSGNVLYHIQYDNYDFGTSQESKSLQAINKTSTGVPIAAGQDKTREWILKFNPTGNSYNNQISTRYKSSTGGIINITSDLLVSDIHETRDGSGDLVVYGTYFGIALPPVFASYIHRIKANATTSVWTKRYDFGLAGILPKGSTTSDNGFILSTTQMGMTGFQFHLIKTDPAGLTPVDGCPPSDFKVTNESGASTTVVPYYNAFSGTVKSQSLTLAVIDLTLNRSNPCVHYICAPPDAPTVTVTQQPDCNNPNGAVSLTNLPSGNWTIHGAPSGDINGSGASTTISNLPPGSYTFTVEVEDCESNASNTVTINPVPPLHTANASANPTSICEGESINLQGSTNATGTSTYSWTGPNGFTSNQQNPTISNATASNAGNYTLIVTNGSCNSAPANVTITVNPIPIVQVDPTTLNLCAGETIQLGATATNGGSSPTYTWNGPNGFTSNQQNPTIPNATTNHSGNYTVTVTGDGGCSSDAKTVNVTIYSIPDLDYTKTDVSCFGGDNGSATVTVTGDGPFSYSWSPSGGNAATANNLEAGTYTVSVTGANDCANTIQVIIEAPDQIQLSTSSTASDCTEDNGSATVTASGGNGSYTYQWDSNANNQTTATASNLGAGTYNVTVTDAGGCQESIAVIVTNPNAPIIQSADVQDANCEAGDDGSISIQTTSGTGTHSYAWNPGGATSATITDLEEGDYTVTVTDEAGCSTDSTFTIGFINSLPEILEVTAEETTICEGENITLHAQTSGDVTGYSWNGPNGFTSNDTDPIIPNATTSNGGNYTLTVTNTHGCESNSASINITVNVTPSAPSAATEQEFCESAIVADLVATGSNLVWYANEDDTTPLASEDALTNGETYYVSQANGNCESEKTKVKVNITPAPDAGTINGDNDVCQNTSSIYVSNGNTNGTWSISNNSIATIDEDGNLTTIATGEVTIYYTVEGQGVCGDDVASYTVTIHEIPEITIISYPEIVCENDDIIISAEGAEESATYSWTSAGGFSNNNASFELIDVSKEEEDIYYVTVTSEWGCIYEDKFELIVNSLPIITEIQKGQESSCLGSSVTLEVINPDSDYTYVWYFEDEKVNTGNKYSIDAANKDYTGTYIILAQNEAGCTSIAQEIILTIDACELEIVETFSPNGDGINDYFTISNIESFPNTEIWIYTRWGMEVYHSENYQNEWDGISQNSLNMGSNILPEGTYYYVIILGGDKAFQAEAGKEFKGYVYLKR